MASRDPRADIVDNNPFPKPKIRPEDFEDMNPLFKKFSLYAEFFLYHSNTFAPIPNRLLLEPLKLIFKKLPILDSFALFLYKIELSLMLLTTKSKSPSLSKSS